MRSFLHSVVLSFAVLALLLASLANGHFPFVIAAEDGSTARLLFSETLEPDEEVDIALLRSASLAVIDAHGLRTPLAMPTTATDGKWFSLALPGSGTRCVTGEVDLGVMQRGNGPAHRLVYFPKAIVGDASAPSTRLGKSVPVELVPERGGEGLRLLLLIAGQPAPATEVRLVSPDGKETKETTDSEGRTRVLDRPGRYGAWARHWIDESGEREGKAFTQVRRYATIVFDLPAAKETTTAAVSQETQPALDADAGMALPRAVASFGAVMCDGAVYVYGGHSGKRHDYSTATVSGRFSRMRMTGVAQPVWEELPGGPQVQGLNLATHRGTVIRVGGMEPRNAPGQAADNHSIAEVARFDPAAGSWSLLPSLPDPRSSHDVVVVGDTMVVVGGWNLGGKGRPTAWPTTTLVLELDREGAQWDAIPQPFARRALTAAVLGHEVFVIGGFDAEDRPQRSVDILDVTTRSWRSGPELPGSPRNGFAPAACTVDGRIFVSVASGELFRLSASGDRWEPFARTTPRIVHRLVPRPGALASDQPSAILLLGGATEASMTDLVEMVSTDGTKAIPLNAIVSADESRAIVLPPTGAVRGADHSLEDAMLVIDELMDELRASDRGGWTGPAAEAIEKSDRLIDLLASVATSGTDRRDPDRYAALQAESEQAARRLRAVLADEQSPPADRSAHLRTLRATCIACHDAYR